MDAGLHCGVFFFRTDHETRLDVGTHNEAQHKNPPHTVSSTAPAIFWMDSKTLGYMSDEKEHFRKRLNAPTIHLMTAVNDLL